VTPLQPYSLMYKVDSLWKKAIVATAKAKIQVREPPNLVRIDHLMDYPLHHSSSPPTSLHAHVLTIAGGSYYVITKSLSANVYQDLIDRGWRR
jgi:hypothetical protein